MRSVRPDEFVDDWRDGFYNGHYDWPACLAVLKSDYTWGGSGVTVVASMAEAERAFRRLSSPGNLLRAVKRLVADHDSHLFHQWLRGVRPALSVQRYIHGKPANCAAACWGGEVIAMIGVEVVVAQSATGNATVVRLVDNPDMIETARRVVRYLGISGFCGLDFMIEEKSGQAYLLEINPRATQINHLSLGPGRDLVAALRSRVADAPIRELPPVTDREIIALFPQELRRDPKSSYLLGAYHDVPRDEPDLVRAYVAGPESAYRFPAPLPGVVTIALGGTRTLPNSPGAE